MNTTLPTRIAIVGSRKYPRLDDVREYVRALRADSVVISGGAYGVDETAEDEARQCGLEVMSIRPNYDLFERRAPLIRNEDIVAGCEWLVAFWDGVSRGTAHSVGLAKRAHKTFICYTRRAAAPERLSVVTRRWRGPAEMWKVEGWRTAGTSTCPDCGKAFELVEEIEGYYPKTGEIERMGNIVTGWGMPHGGCEQCGVYLHGGFEHDYIIRPRKG